MSVSGYQQLQRNINAMIKKNGFYITEAIDASCNKVRNYAVKSIQEVSRGETVIRYRNGGNGYEHVQSKKGDAPNTDTGNLANSITKEIGNKEGYVGVTSKSKDYAHVLEDKRKLNRPFLLPALEANEEIVKKLIKTAFIKTAKYGKSRPK